METFYWNTEYYHPDNNFTMQEYLSNYLSIEFEIILEDGTYAEIRNILDGLIYGVHASGNGDSSSHKIEFELL